MGDEFGRNTDDLLAGLLREIDNLNKGLRALVAVQFAALSESSPGDDARTWEIIRDYLDLPKEKP